MFNNFAGVVYQVAIACPRISTQSRDRHPTSSTINSRHLFKIKKSKDE
ncbi:MAG TPA: hypothetical protein VK211_14275 [Kamptonema sp.]|nr:hypothetical protein [Kamptonema sp.]